jgi:4'-phosphopantetheinyl transferase
MKVYWLEQTEADVPVSPEWLSASESAHLNALRVPKRRSDWRLGRWTAKRALSAYLKAPGDLHSLADIEIRPAASGAPEVFVAGQPAVASISLSHSNGTALCVAATFGTALGCDLELVEPRSDAFVADYFTSDEQALIAQASAAQRPWLLALLWSAKESALKALHEGLRLDTRSVAVSLLESPLTSAVDTGRWPEQSDLTLREHLSIWHPLEVHHTDGAIFRGWSQRAGCLLRTLVAAPRPMTPIPLEVRN